MKNKDHAELGDGTRSERRADAQNTSLSGNIKVQATAYKMGCRGSKLAKPILIASSKKKKKKELKVFQ